MSWEEVLGLLPAALQALERPAPSCAVTATEQFEYVMELYNISSTCLNQADQPSQSEQEALRRACVRLGELLAATAGSFFGNDGVAERQQWTGANAWRLSTAASLTRLAACGGALLRSAPGAEQDQFCLHLAPLLNGSSAVLAALSVAASELPQPHLESAQVLAVTQVELFATLCTKRPFEDPVLTRLAASWPPDALAAWLAGALAFLPRTRTGCLEPPLQLSFACVCVNVCGRPVFRGHTPALQRHPQLCPSLLGALLPMLRAAAVAARLPAERQRQAAFSWKLVRWILLALLSEVLYPALYAWAAAADTDGLAAQMSSLVQLAEPALEAFSRSSGDSARSAPETANLLEYMVGVLNALVAGLLGPMQAQQCQGPASQPMCNLASKQRWQLLAKVLPALRQLAAQLRVALGASASGLADTEGIAFSLHLFCHRWGALLSWLPALVQGRQPGDGGLTERADRSADLASWCTAVAAGLQALPLLADAHQQLLHLGDGVGAGKADGVACGVVAAAKDVSFQVGRAAALLERPSGALSPGDMAALGDALWLLHSTSARAVFWAEAGGWRQLPCLQNCILRENLAAVPVYVMMAASLAQRARRGANNSPPVGAGRHLSAVCVAHWEVLQLLLASTAQEGRWGLDGIDLVHQLSYLVAHGPAALATSPRLQALLRDALDHSTSQGEAEQVASSAAAAAVAAAPAAAVNANPSVDTPSLLHPCIQGEAEQVASSAAAAAVAAAPAAAAPAAAVNANPSVDRLTIRYYWTIAGLLQAPRLTALLLTSRWLDRMLRDMARSYSKERHKAMLEFFGCVGEGLKTLKNAAAELDCASSSGGGGSSSRGASSSSPQQQLEAALAAAGHSMKGNPGVPRGLRVLLEQALPPARQVAAALQEAWRRPELAEAERLELAQAAAARSCAYLRCANLGGEGGPAAGQGRGSLRCGKCRAVWYCGTECSHADWPSPGRHRRMCGVLAAVRQAARQEAADERACADAEAQAASSG